MPLALPPPSSGLSDGSGDRITFGSGKAVPPGVESLIQFNGLLLNRRDLIDTFLINEIDGLADADIRDDREVNPSAHGETAFDAFYGGRTVTFTGKIRAFTLDKLRDMTQALRQAFNPLEEMPMTFYGHADSSAVLYCRKSAPISIKEAQTQANQFDRDFLITVRASNPRFLSRTNEVSNRSFVVFDQFATNSFGEGVYTFAAGSGSINAPSGFAAVSDTTAKQFIRNDRLFSGDNEVVIKYTPGTTFTGSLVAGILKALDSENWLEAGVDATGHLVIKKYNALTPSTIFTSGATVPARSAGNDYWIRVIQNGNVIQIDHATIDPRIDESGINLTTQQTLGGTDATDYGVGALGQPGCDLKPGGTTWTFDDISMGAASVSGLEAVTSNNLGNFDADPILVIAGPMINPEVTNQANGDTLSMTGSIPAGDAWTIDVGNRAMVSSIGVNKFSALDVGSDWMTLEPGENKLAFTGQNMSAEQDPGGVWAVPQLTVYHRDTWL